MFNLFPLISSSHSSIIYIFLRVFQLHFETSTTLIKLFYLIVILSPFSSCFRQGYTLIEIFTLRCRHFLRSLPTRLDHLSLFFFLFTNYRRNTIRKRFTCQNARKIIIDSIPVICFLALWSWVISHSVLVTQWVGDLSKFVRAKLGTSADCREELNEKNQSTAFQALPLLMTLWATTVVVGHVYACIDIYLDNVCTDTGAILAPCSNLITLRLPLLLLS